MRSESVFFLCVLQVHTLTGHESCVFQVAFNHDGAQFLSAGQDNTVRFWDFASGRQVRQLAGDRFALVKGLAGEHKRDRHIITTSGDKIRIYEVGNEEQDAEGGAAADPVACFQAPQAICSVQCFGAAICVGCEDGAVCILSAPFLAA
jgi:WD40 repeat protein